MLFKINLASLIVGRKFTVFALFYFVSEGGFQVLTPRGGLYLEGRFNGGFLCVTSLGGLYLEGAYTRRGLFSEFYGISVFVVGVSKWPYFQPEIC